jgi:hypothetical protein
MMFEGTMRPTSSQPSPAVTVAGWPVAWDDGHCLGLAHCAWCQPMTTAMVALQYTTHHGRTLLFTGGICPTCAVRLRPPPVYRAVVVPSRAAGRPYTSTLINAAGVVGLVTTATSDPSTRATSEVVQP